MRTRIKICGITQPEDALICAQHGVDAIGLVFYSASPRAANIAQAKAIKAVLPPFVSVVGLFVNAQVNEVEMVISEVGLDCLQFHGDETPEFCQQFKVPYFKAVRVKSESNLLQYAVDFKEASALLLDAYDASAYGGTGKMFDWRLIPKHLPKPIILAGGLEAENVSAAIAQVAPYAVDVSGGVELAKGKKDASKIAAFVQAVNQHLANKPAI